MFHGRGGHNRWFDKAISVVLTADGKLGLNGEVRICTRELLLYDQHLTITLAFSMRRTSPSVDV